MEVIRLLVLFIFYACSALADNLTTSQFISNINKHNFAHASQTNDPVLHDLAIWLKLTSEKDSNFYELAKFIKSHPNWPKIDVLTKKLEESKDAKDIDYLNWYKLHGAQTQAGKLKFLALLNDAALKKKHAELIWSEADFNAKEQTDFIKKYGAMLSLDDYIRRINYLLYKRQLNLAANLLKFLPDNLRKLYNFRIDLARKKHDPAKIALNHTIDTGILHDIAHLHDGEDNEEELIKTLVFSSKQDHSMHAYFWRLKAKLIRKLVQEKDYKTAYLFAHSHGNQDIKEYSEAEWLAGWIALSYLNSPKVAITHFNNFYQKVKMPISLARGAYWLARSYEKLDDQANAINWYKISAQYFSSFYGQLSLCKINNCQMQLPPKQSFSPTERLKYSGSPLIKAALTLEKSKYNYLSKLFFKKAIENSKDPKEIAYITTLYTGKDHHIATELAKQASYKNVIVIEAGYPRPEYVYFQNGVDKALTFSLIRQESVFNKAAISTAGAMGLMQIMPHVAKQTAKNIGVKYHKNKLTSDPIFNTRLGVNHLQELLEKYDNSYILAIAAYNAGAKAVNKWIENNGDPRLMKKEEEIINWLEQITYHETRNYVQRVLENRAIYNSLITQSNKIEKCF